MRPPCVVHMPNSSASERSHRTLPSRESDITRPLPLIAKTLPDAGSTAGDDQAMPVRRHVAREDVVAVLPQQLAGVGVEAHQPFLLGRARARRCSEGRGGRRTRPAPNGRRTAPSTRGSGRRATTTLGRPVSVDDAGAGRAAPLRPVRAAQDRGRGQRSEPERDSTSATARMSVHSLHSRIGESATEDTGLSRRTSAGRGRVSSAVIASRQRPSAAIVGSPSRRTRSSARQPALQVGTVLHSTRSRLTVSSAGAHSDGASPSVPALLACRSYRPRPLSRRSGELAAVARTGRPGHLERAEAADRVAAGAQRRVEGAGCRPGIRRRSCGAIASFVTAAIEGEVVPGQQGGRAHAWSGKPWIHPDSVAADRKHTFKVLALDAKTGKILWEHDGVRRAGLRRAPPRAAASPGRRRRPTARWCTPTSVPRGSTRTTSTASWRGRWWRSSRRSGWAPARRRCSIENLVIIQRDEDNGDGSAIVAYDKRTGKEVWRRSATCRSAGRTPVLVEAGRPHRARDERRPSSSSPTTRRPARSCGGRSGVESNAIHTPLVGHGLVIVTAGYPGEEGHRHPAGRRRRRQARGVGVLQGHGLRASRTSSTATTSIC